MNMHGISNPLPYLAAALILAVGSGCDRNSVKVYKVDTKETSSAPLPTATMPSSMPGDIPAPDNSGLPKLKYTLPAGWKDKALTQLRVASLEVAENGKTADVSVIPLGGMAGGDLANVNRWRGQIGLAPIAETELEKATEAVTIAGSPAGLYDIVGTNPGSGNATRILGAILHGEATAWYFKMMGDADLVAGQKANFIAFLKSADFDKLAAPSTMDMSQLPPSHPPIPGMTPENPLATPTPTNP
jgi:hypothetical protein